MQEKHNSRSGSSLEDLFKEEGCFEEVRAAAIKKVIATRIGAAMRAQDITKAAMARRMRTSRSQVDRLLDPKNHEVTLKTLVKAAAAVGMTMDVSLS